MERLVSHTTLLTMYQRQNNQLQTKALGSINTHSAHTLRFKKMRTHQLPCIFYVSRAGETAQLIKVLNAQGGGPECKPSTHGQSAPNTASVVPEIERQRQADPGCLK